VAYGAVRAARNAGLLLFLAAPVQAETVIAALGDSLIQGYWLPRDQGFVPQLEAWLVEHGADVRVLNAGVSGDTTAGGLSRIDWTLTDEVDAVIVALGGNDVLRGLEPDTSRRNLDAIIAAAEAADVEVLLVGLSAPGNYGPAYKAAFDAIYPDLAREHDALLAPGFFALLEADGRDAALAHYIQPDGLHPNAAGVAMIVEALGPIVLELVERTGD
jgi:acyl-CoA thioesterase-1